MNEHFTGYHKARLGAGYSRFRLLCITLAMTAGMLMSAFLAGNTAVKKEWQFASEARV
ncbi:MULTISPECIES: hypothetical protein [unclassified Ensifer]|uniref:hypothetical protein n=1 Tax=unclassified Ensifer TaxID=2633371 RepID=UPI000B0D5EC4|nr:MULTISPECIES: hypothetical protein [unclassified Ensifer]